MSRVLRCRSFPDSLSRFDFRRTDEIRGTVVLVHVGKDYQQLIGDLGLWLARDSVFLHGRAGVGGIEWRGAPEELTGYTTTVASFWTRPPAPTLGSERP
jgi:hypothetical protein